MAEFTFNGKSSGDYGLRVKNAIIIKSPERDFEAQEIAGFDGDIFISRKRFKSVEIVFPCRLSKSVFDTYYSLFDLHDEINAWLLSDEKFHDLIFDGDSRFVYRALHKGGDSIERLTEWAGNTELVFSAYPWKFLQSGRSEITITGNSKTLTNPLKFEALPKIRVSGSGSVTITFTNSGKTQTLILVNLVSSETITIDCETEEVYSGNDNRSARVASYPFPSLGVGDTTITISGTHSLFAITPNWRTLV